MHDLTHFVRLLLIFCLLLFAGGTQNFYQTYSGLEVVSKKHRFILTMLFPLKQEQNLQASWQLAVVFEVRSCLVSFRRRSLSDPGFVCLGLQSHTSSASWFIG